MTRADNDTLPHETDLGPAPADRPPPRLGLPWVVWHPTGARPTREGGSWTATLDTLRSLRPVWIIAVPVWVVLGLMAATAPDKQGALSHAAWAFVAALAGALTLAADVLALPIARMERRWAEESLRARAEEVAGRSLGHCKLVGLTHDARPEWPPGSFADWFALLEVLPEGLVLHSTHGRLTFKREQVIGLVPAHYKCSAGHAVARGEDRVPCVKYTIGGSGAVGTLVIEALSGPSPREIAAASGELYEELQALLRRES
jgi:hypothetical protein